MDVEMSPDVCRRLSLGILLSFKTFLKEPQNNHANTVQLKLTATTDEANVLMADATLSIANETNTRSKHLGRQKVFIWYVGCTHIKLYLSII